MKREINYCPKCKKRIGELIIDYQYHCPYCKSRWMIQKLE